jgi:DNA-binding response OmpR family regulator
VGDVAFGQVLVVSADERWLRVLEVTLRLGGAETVSRRSAREAFSLAGHDSSMTAIVIDLAQVSGDDLEVARGLLDHSPLPAVVILPERMAAHQESFAAAGATVLVRPYRPSELYAALRITEADLPSDADVADATASDPDATTPEPTSTSPEPTTASTTPAATPEPVAASAVDAHIDVEEP